MKKPITIVVVLLVIAVAAVLWINSTINSHTRMLIEDLGPRVTGSDVTVEHIDLSIISGGGSIADLVIANPIGFGAQPLLQTNTAQITLDSGTVFGSPVVIRELAVDEVVMTYEPGEGGSNLALLLDRVEKLPSQNPSNQDTMLVIERLRVARTIVQSTEGAVLVELPETVLEGVGDATDGTTATLARAQVLRHVLTAAIDGLTEKGVLSN